MSDIAANRFSALRRDSSTTVSTPLASRDSLRNFAEILNQTVAFRMWESTLEQRELCDVLIVPRVLDRAFCQRLIRIWHEGGNHESGTITSHCVNSV